MARIKTIARQNALTKFKSLVEQHRNLCRNRNRKEDPHQSRIAFENELDRLFDIGAKDAVEEIMKNRLLNDDSKLVDIAFYRDQQTQRKSHMSGHDKIFEKKAKNKLIRDSQIKQIRGKL